jgi:hypothetical protein
MKLSTYSYILLLCYAISDSSCHRKLAPQGNTLNKEITDEGGKPQLLGKMHPGKIGTGPL